MADDPRVNTQGAAQWRNLDDLVQWKANYNEGDIGQIMTSILEFGYNRTISVWRNNIVMAGNHTMLALKLAKRSGYTPIDPETVPNDYTYQKNEFACNNLVVIDGAWVVQVSDCSHLSQVKANAYAIADNRAAEMATQDEALLLQHLQEVHDYDLEHDGHTLQATGYTQEDMADIAEALDLILDEQGQTLEGDDPDGNDDGGSSVPSNNDPVIRVKVSTDTFIIWLSLVDGLQDPELPDAMHAILNAVDTTKLPWIDPD